MQGGIKQQLQDQMSSMKEGIQQQIEGTTKQLHDEKATMKHGIQQQFQDEMAVLQGSIQQQLVDSTMKLENMLYDKLAAVEEDVKGLREVIELKTSCLWEKLIVEAKQLREELERVQVCNGTVAPTTAPRSKFGEVRMESTHSVGLKAPTFDRNSFWCNYRKKREAVARTNG